MKKIVLMMLAAACMISCSKSDLEETAKNSGNVDIRLTSIHKTVAGDATRAPYVGTISENNPLEARVLASTTSGDYATTHANGKMIFRGGTSVSAYEISTVTATEAKFPGDGTAPLYLCGLYPCTV